MTGSIVCVYGGGGGGVCVCVVLDIGECRYAQRASDRSQGGCVDGRRKRRAGGGGQTSAYTGDAYSSVQIYGGWGGRFRACVGFQRVCMYVLYWIGGGREATVIYDRRCLLLTLLSTVSTTATTLLVSALPTG